VELVVKDTTDSPNLASYLDLYLEHDITGTLTTKLYDKLDSFKFPTSICPVNKEASQSRFHTTEINI